jgi:VWFA-related protein
MINRFHKKRFGYFIECILLLVLWCAGMVLPGKMRAFGAPVEPALGTGFGFATVEVSVKNKKGDSVPGLKKEDFEIYINGKRQEIISFEEILPDSSRSSASGNGGIPTESRRQGKVVMILFDDHAISLSQLKVTRDAAEIYVKKHMHSQDLVAVAFYGRDLQVVQPFTHDTSKVLEAIRKPSATFGQSQLGAGFSGIEGQQLAKNVVRSLTNLVNNLGSIQGKKSILFFTEDFGVVQDQESIHLLELSRRNKVSFYTLIATNASATARKLKPEKSSGLARANTGKKPSQTTQLAKAGKESSPVSILAQAAQRFLPGITLLDLSVVALLMPQASQGGPPSNLPSGPTGSQINDSSVRDSVDHMENKNTGQEYMQALAKETYGDVVRESNDLTKGLNSIDVELSNYYVLAYLPANVKMDDKLAKVEIKTSVKDVKLFYARGAFLANSSSIPEMGANEKVLTGALNSQAPATGLPLEMKPVIFYDSPQSARVQIIARLKAALQQNSAGKRWDFMGAAFDVSGKVAARFSGSKTTAELAIDSTAGSDLFYRNQLLLKPGKYQIKLAVADETGKASSQSQSLEIPALPEKALGVSSLIISHRIYPLPDLIRNVQPQLLNETNPMAFKGYEIIPSMGNRVNRQTPLSVFYKIYNLAPGGPDRILSANPSLTDEQGQTHALTPLRLTRVVQPVGPGQLAVGFNFPVKDLAPGKYRLTIETMDPSTQQSTVCHTDVYLE